MYGTKMFYTVTACLSRWVVVGNTMKKGDLCTKNTKVSKGLTIIFQIWNIAVLHDNTGPKMITWLYIINYIRFSIWKWNLWKEKNCGYIYILVIFQSALSRSSNIYTYLKRTGQMGPLCFHRKQKTQTVWTQWRTWRTVNPNHPQTS